MEYTKEQLKEIGRRGWEIFMDENLMELILRRRLEHLLKDVFSNEKVIYEKETKWKIITPEVPIIIDQTTGDGFF